MQDNNAGPLRQRSSTSAQPNAIASTPQLPPAPFRRFYGLLLLSALRNGFSLLDLVQLNGRGSSWRLLSLQEGCLFPPSFTSLYCSSSAPPDLRTLHAICERKMIAGEPLRVAKAPAVADFENSTSRILPYVVLTVS